MAASINRLGDLALRGVPNAARVREIAALGIHRFVNEAALIGLRRGAFERCGGQGLRRVIWAAA